MPHHLLVFLVGSLVVTVVPGPDMALVTRQVVTRGRRAAQATILGNLSGLVVHASALTVIPSPIGTWLMWKVIPAAAISALTALTPALNLS